MVSVLVMSLSFLLTVKTLRGMLHIKVKSYKLKKLSIERAKRKKQKKKKINSLQ